MIDEGERGWGLGEEGEGVKKHKSPVMKTATGI